MTKKIYLVGLLLILGLGSPPSHLAQAAVTYGAWVPYWKKTAGVAEIIAHLDQLKEISPFSFEVKNDGSLTDPLKLASEPWPGLFSAAKQKKIKIIPTIYWGDGKAIHATLSVPAKRAIHIAAILAAVETNQVDGIDIDYENKIAASRIYFSRFIKELSTALHAKSKTLSCTIEPRTPPDSRYLEVPAFIEYVNDYAVLGEYCDQVRIVAYDQTTIDIKLNQAKRQGSFYAPIADLDWVKKVVRLTAGTISRKKLVVGVANYGYEFRVIDKGSFYDYDRLRSVSYTQAITLARQVGATSTRNNAGELSFTYQKNGETRLVWFSDAVAIAQKVAFAKTYGLRGVILFRPDGEDDPSLWNSFN